jgi:flagellar protein FlaG
MNQLNGHLQQAGSELKIQADKDSGRTVYKVVNPATGEIVYQYPTEEMLAMARSLQTSEKQLGTSGVLVDKQG